MNSARHSLGTSTKKRSDKRLRRAIRPVFEQMEARRLMSNTLFVYASDANVTLDVRANGGVETIIGGVTTDYSAGQWSDVSVTDAGDITVKATVVPVSIGTHTGPITFHNIHGMRDIQATVSIDPGLPDDPYYDDFNVTFDETGDTTARTITMERINGARVINGMAPGNIFIQEDYHIQIGGDDYWDHNNGTINFITGSGADHLNIEHSGTSDVLHLSSFGGTDTVNVGGNAASGNYVAGEIHL